MVQSPYKISGSTASQIASSVEIAVISGKVRPGDRLPPVRTLAIECGVSPATAAAAFRRLRERGLVHSDGRRGTRVLPQPGTAASARTIPRATKVASHGT